VIACAHLEQVRVVIEERLHQVEVAAGQQRPVQQPLVLKRETPAPQPIVFMREQRAVGLLCRMGPLPVGVGFQTQLLREQAAVELGLNPPAALAGHQVAEDVVALCGQGGPVLLLAETAGRGFAIKLFADLRWQRAVRGDDPTPVPESGPPRAVRFPIARGAGRLPRVPLNRVDPRLRLGCLHRQGVDADVEGLAAATQGTVLESQRGAFQQVAERIETKGIGQT
jgi:hypothetical protein